MAQIVGYQRLVEPGKICGGCGRRVPHPKKPSTPKSVTVAFRVPTDEYKAFQENREEAQKAAGVYELPYADFKAYSFAHVLLLQHADEVREAVGADASEIDLNERTRISEEIGYS